MTTDLSAAYDTVDHNILIRKLKHYGVNNDAAESLKSFLKNRESFVEIQGFRSTKCENLPCSVIQGSKMSGFLYTIYSIEIPLIPKILRDQQLAELLMEIQIPRYYSVDHTTNQFIDDSSNVIGAQTFDELENYSNDFLKILEKFYKMNKLKINSSKTMYSVLAVNIMNLAIINISWLVKSKVNFI